MTPNKPYMLSASVVRHGWAKTGPRLCAAIVDRLTFGGTIIETGTDSYRLAQTRARDHAAS